MLMFCSRWHNQNLVSLDEVVVWVGASWFGLLCILQSWLWWFRRTHPFQSHAQTWWWTFLPYNTIERFYSAYVMNQNEYTWTWSNIFYQHRGQTCALFKIKTKCFPDLEEVKHLSRENLSLTEIPQRLILSYLVLTTHSSFPIPFKDQLGNWVAK